MNYRFYIISILSLMTFVTFTAEKSIEPAHPNRVFSLDDEEEQFKRETDAKIARAQRTVQEEDLESTPEKAVQIKNDLCNSRVHRVLAHNENNAKKAVVAAFTHSPRPIWTKTSDEVLQEHLTHLYDSSFSPHLRALIFQYAQEFKGNPAGHFKGPHYALSSYCDNDGAKLLAFSENQDGVIESSFHNNSKVKIIMPARVRPYVSDTYGSMGAEKTALGCSDGTIQLYDHTIGRIFTRYRVSDIGKFATDLAVYAGPNDEVFLAYCMYGGTISLYNCSKRFSINSHPGTNAASSVVGCAFALDSLDEGAAAYGLYDTGDLIKISQPGVANVHKFEGAAASLYCTPHELFVGLVDGRIYRRAAGFNDFELYLQLPKSTKFLKMSKVTVEGIDCLVTVSETEARIWNMKTSECIGIMPIDSGIIAATVTSQGNDILIAASYHKSYTSDFMKTYVMNYAPGAVEQVYRQHTNHQAHESAQGCCIIL